MRRRYHRRRIKRTAVISRVALGVTAAACCSTSVPLLAAAYAETGGSLFASAPSETEPELPAPEKEKAQGGSLLVVDENAVQTEEAEAEVFSEEAETSTVSEPTPSLLTEAEDANSKTEKARKNTQEEIEDVESVLTDTEDEEKTDDGKTEPGSVLDSEVEDAPESGEPDAEETAETSAETLTEDETTEKADDALTEEKAEEKADDALTEETDEDMSDETDGNTEESGNALTEEEISEDAEQSSDDSEGISEEDSEDDEDAEKGENAEEISDKTQETLAAAPDELIQSIHESIHASVGFGYSFNSLDEDTRKMLAEYLTKIHGEEEMTASDEEMISEEEEAADKDEEESDEDAEDTTEAEPDSVSEDEEELNSEEDEPADAEDSEEDGSEDTDEPADTDIAEENEPADADAENSEEENQEEESDSDLASQEAQTENTEESSNSGEELDENEEELDESEEELPDSLPVSQEEAWKSARDDALTPGLVSYSEWDNEGTPYLISLNVEQVRQEEQELLDSFKKPKKEKTVYAAQPLNVRSEPNADADIVGYLSLGEAISVSGVSKETEWIRVTYDDQVAYVNGKYTDDEEQAGTDPDNPYGSDIIALATKIANDNSYYYSYGGNGPKGYDCSHFVCYVLRQCGYNVSYHTSSSCLNLEGAVKVSGCSSSSWGNAKAGDVIVWDGHVAFYAGNNTVVHAKSSKSGIVVDTGKTCPGSASGHKFLGIVRLTK